jgi:hypothetical protein
VRHGRNKEKAELRLKPTKGGTLCRVRFINLIIQLIAGAVGSNAAGATIKNLDLGTLGDAGGRFAHSQRSGKVLKR